MPISLDSIVNSRPRYGYGKPPHPELYAVLNQRRDAYAEHLKALDRLLPDLTEIQFAAETKDPIRPTWLNDWLPALDSIVLFGFVESAKPRTYLEIGSGNSTKFVYSAVRKHNLDTEIISIDPDPRVEIDQLCSRIVRQRLEDTDLSMFEMLREGDILFFDGSHYCLMGSDATVFFLEIMPRLQPGVLVQVHDIFLPFDYPPTWTKRYYSEQYLLAAQLLAGCRGFQVELPVAFIAQDIELSAVLSSFWMSLPQGLEQFGGSFWMRRV